MPEIFIRPYKPGDEKTVIRLWFQCGLIASSNHPQQDIERKRRVNPEWFLVGLMDGQIVGTCMGGYDGHRGWINYLAVSPRHRRQGVGSAMVKEAERLIRSAGCPKINLQVRESNTDVIRFYQKIGFTPDRVVSLGKRLEEDPPFDPEVIAGR